MIQLQPARIGELGRVITGKTPPSERPELLGDRYPFLTPTDIDGVSRYVNPGRYLSDQGHQFQSQLMIPAHSVCVVCIGATIGKVCVANRPSFTNQQINSIIVDGHRHDPSFVYYLLTTLRDELKANAGGAATPIINKTAFSNIQVNVPPLPIQRRIASILSAYDDLIENHRKRIAILEDMARRLYREWFVHFRYPGHESVPLIDSPLGRIPQGWEVRTIGSLCDRVTDGAHLSPRSVDSGLPMASSKDMHAFGLDLSSARHIAPADYVQLERQGCRPLKHDVLITKDGANYCKNVFVQMKDEGVVLLSSIAILRPRKDISPFYLSESLKSREIKERLKLRVSGAAIPRIILADFKQFPLVFPTTDLLNSWSQRVAPMITLCVNLVDQIDVLRRTRDLLLPRLMSGTLSVEALTTAEAAVP